MLGLLTLAFKPHAVFAMAHTIGLSAICIASMTLVVLSTLLLALETRENVKFRPTPINEGVSYLILLVSWLLALACHWQGYINDIAARILTCSMLGVCCCMWWQRCTAPTKTAVDYLIHSVGYAHVGMIVALVWIRQVALGQEFVVAPGE